ncbi:ADP-ribosylation factor GTPase-activating protein agd3 [Sarracenia purpurea var. burkii]
MHFTKLDDSPMFRKQIQCMEESAESLRERSLRFCKGCRKYTEGLGEGYDEDIAFASALETFGGGHNDPVSVAFGGMAPCWNFVLNVIFGSEVDVNWSFLASSLLLKS